LDPTETGNLQYEIYSENGTLLNQSQNVLVQGYNVQNNYSVCLLDFNFKPQPDPENLIVDLNLTVTKEAGEINNLVNSLQVAVVFYNLSVYSTFGNSTLLRYGNILPLSLSFFERDVSHFPASNLSIEFSIMDQQNNTYFLLDQTTDEYGNVTLELNISSLTPNTYFVQLESSNSSIFNDFNFTYPFILYPGDLVALLTIDSSSMPISIPSENIVTNNNFYVQILHEGSPFCPPDFAINWTFLQYSGAFTPAGVSAYSASLEGITQLGNFPLLINGVSSNFTDICLNTTISVIRRTLNVITNYDPKNYSYTLEFFDQETGNQISPESMGSANIYEISSQNLPLKLSYDENGDDYIISPMSIPENQTGLKILITVEENGNYSFFSQIFTTELSINGSQNAGINSIEILLAVILIGGISLCIVFLRIKKNGGFKLKSLKFDL
jgi:hypothetical protein